MGRANNTSRSLVIMSQLQGWDPCKIDGSDYPNCEYPEHRVTEGDTGYLQGPLPTSPQSTRPDITVDTPIDWNTPTRRPEATVPPAVRKPSRTGK